MRCIEMPPQYWLSAFLPRLIETWDVLKCVFRTDYLKDGKGLIETWDVLKLMKLHTAKNEFVGLIETWDVLKSMQEDTMKAGGKD